MYRIQCHYTNLFSIFTICCFMHQIIFCWYCYITFKVVCQPIKSAAITSKPNSAQPLTITIDKLATRILYEPNLLKYSCHILFNYTFLVAKFYKPTGEQSLLCAGRDRGVKKSNTIILFRRRWASQLFERTRCPCKYYHSSGGGRTSEFHKKTPQCICTYVSPAFTVCRLS